MVRHLYGYVSMFQLPGLKVFARRQDISSGRPVAQSRSSRAEILDGSFLQPHILLPPPILVPRAAPLAPSSAASPQPAPLPPPGMAVEPPEAHPQRTPPHRLRHPPSRATFFFTPPPGGRGFFCFFPSALPHPPGRSGRLTGKKFATYEPRIKRAELPGSPSLTTHE